MELYKYDRPKGVAALKQEQMKINSDAAGNRLALAIQKALSDCGPEDEVACRKAATTGSP